MDGDEVEITKISFGSASSFISGEYPDFVIEPAYYNLGEFKISITLKDDHPEPRSATYTFAIKVKALPVQV